MIGTRCACLVIVVALAAVGCKPHELTLDPGARTFTPDSYPRVWEAWTREKESFAWKELSHEIFVGATFESWEFRWAYVIRYAYDYSLAPQARDEMLQASLAGSSKTGEAKRAVQVPSGPSTRPRRSAPTATSPTASTSGTPAFNRSASTATAPKLG